MKKLLLIVAFLALGSVGAKADEVVVSSAPTASTPNQLKAAVSGRTISVKKCVLAAGIVSGTIDTAKLHQTFVLKSGTTVIGQITALQGTTATVDFESLGGLKTAAGSALNVTALWAAAETQLMCKVLVDLL